jgi:general secretion pathway protein G
MLARKQVARGFTLVEILIVVVILGILAAIVIPQFTNASESAKSSSLSSQLQTIRSQLELYQVQHNGNYPDLSVASTIDADGNTWNPLTKPTDLNGAINVLSGAFGPYLQQSPSNGFIPGTGTPPLNITVNQLGDGTGVVAAPGFTNVGWAYSMDTGEIKANIPNTVDTASLNLVAGPDYNLE